jgi:hypothetical protein
VKASQIGKCGGLPFVWDLVSLRSERREGLDGMLCSIEHFNTTRRPHKIGDPLDLTSHRATRLIAYCSNSIWLKPAVHEAR